MKKRNVGSDFDDFLAQEGMLEEVAAVAVQRVITWQMEQEMAAQKSHKDGHGQEDAYMTPHNVHYGHALALRSACQATLETAFLAHPKRFKGRQPQPPALPTAAWINPPPKEISIPQNPQPCTVNS